MIEQAAKILVDAGATGASAARVVPRLLDDGVRIADLFEEIELAAEPAQFEGELLGAQLARLRDLQAVTRD